MLAYCDVCRVVQFDPSPCRARGLDPIKQVRVLTGSEFFAHCYICGRSQAFVPVEKIVLPPNEPAG